MTDEIKFSDRRQALPAIAVGHIVIATVMVANGTIGARLHIPFPVLNRSSFGFWLSYFSVISRVILSMFWFGVQTFTGSECVYQVRHGPLSYFSVINPSDENNSLDVESYLALNCAHAEPSSTWCEHNYFW